MKNLVINPATREHLENFMRAPSHAVLLAGSTGSGKMTLANYLAEALLALAAGGLANYPYKMVIISDGGKAIGIEAIRQMEPFLSLKVPGRGTYNRVIIIEDSQLLGLEAQNALLKTLEEPPQGTLIILTVTHEQSLLPTIRSRVQSIAVKRPAEKETEAYFMSLGFGNSAIKQAYAISGGLPGLMQALLTEDEHPLKAATERARQLLSQTAYERLVAVDQLSKDRKLAIDITFILQQMAHVSLQRASGQAANKWQAVLSSSYEASQALQSSAQPKLVLTKLMLGI